ncbi:MAG: CHC2 zinc finger domain-containing protein [Deltaproteobacteria bacterium]|nr:CHC2 zinc finger domain-containing protein [Deltaproteobacteria bacterium]
MTLLALLSQDGFTLTKTATTHGGEYAGLCPWCGGNDRFRVWPEDRDGRYWCRGCGKSGDAIQYLREYRGMSYREACELLNITPAQHQGEHCQERTTFTPKEPAPPPATWVSKATAFLKMARTALWTDAGSEARAFLCGKGLSDDTIKKSGLGWSALDYYRTRESWGLPTELKENGTPKKLWLPSGIVIPCFVDDIFLARLRVRRPEGKPRYILIPGSDTRPMILNPDMEAVVLVESELDSILLRQEAGDLATIVALGSVSAKPDATTHDLLNRAQIILLALDSDDAGRKSSWSFWNDTYGRKVKRWPPIEGKDPSEAWQNGLNVREWIIAGLFGSEKKYERFCIQTIDGGLSDAEALREALK